jgi:Mg2+/Co2+ transporter CorB
MWQWFETNIMNGAWLDFAWLDGDGWVTLITILILLVFSGLLSGSETALTATSKARMLRLEQEGSVRARWVIALLDRKEHLISAILLCNNLVNILASVLATSFFLRVIGENGLVYATVIMTITVVIFAEVLPKTYAILTPDMTALRMSWILRIVVWLLSPMRMKKFAVRSTYTTVRVPLLRMIVIC